MKMFVLATVALTPAAFCTWVRASPANTETTPVDSPPTAMLVADVASVPSPADFKLRVVRPPTAPRARMLVARPDDRYDYRLRMPQSPPPMRRRLPETPGR
jgi:hypothetical protein